MVVVSMSKSKEEVEDELRELYDKLDPSVGLSPSFKYSKLNNIVVHKIENDYDVKLMITARDSGVGMGKTTLAVLLAKEWSNYFGTTFDTDDNLYFDMQKYADYYVDEASKGEVIVLDDVEQKLDARSYMSKINRKVSQMLALLRTKNVITIFTCPNVGFLDRRVGELSDYQLLVRRRGVAVPYEFKIDDTSQKSWMRRLRNYKHSDKIGGTKEVILFGRYDGKELEIADNKKLEFAEKHFREIDS